MTLDVSVPFRSCRRCGAALARRRRRCSQCGLSDAAWYHGSGDRQVDGDDFEVIRLWVDGGLRMVVERLRISAADALRRLDSAGAFAKSPLDGAQVRWLYDHPEIRLAAAAAFLGVGERTVRRWRRRLAGADTDRTVQGGPTA